MKINLAPLVGGITVGILMISPFAYGQQAEQQTTTTTTVQQTSTKAPVAHRPVRHVVHRAPAATSTQAVDNTTVTNTTTTTAVPPPPPVVVKEEARKVYDEETLKKMEHNICAQGFKAYIGSNDKNICRSKANPPDLAYTCMWDKKGAPAFAATPAGPCNLDYTEYQGKIVIDKTNYPHDNPFDYGTEVECCFRAAKGPPMPVTAR